MWGSFSWKVQFLRTNYIFNYADESTCTCFKTAISVFVERRTTNINLSYFSLTLINESCCSKYNCSLKFSLLHILQVCLISFFFTHEHFYIYSLSFFFLKNNSFHVPEQSMHGFGLVRYGSTPVSSYIFFPQRLPTLYPQILDYPVFLQKNILSSDWTAVVCLQYREIWQLIG